MPGKLAVCCCALVPAVASLFLGGGNRQITADEAYVARVYANCAAFTPSPHHCSFAVAATPDTASGRLYAVELRYQTGDDCYAGIVYFFDQTRFITRTRDLPPDSIGGVTKVHADGAGRFTVVYLVDKDQGHLVRRGRRCRDRHLHLPVGGPPHGQAIRGPAAPS
jgi:hypothetical protein